MQCTLVNVYYGPQQYMYDYYISFRERHYESQQWHWFEYFSVHYRQKEINIKQDFILPRGILVRLVMCVMVGHRKLKIEIIKLLTILC